MHLEELSPMLFGTVPITRSFLRVGRGNLPLPFSIQPIDFLWGLSRETEGASQAHTAPANFKHREPSYSCASDRYPVGRRSDPS